MKAKKIGTTTLALLRMLVEAYYNFQSHRKAASNQFRNIIYRLVTGTPFDQPVPKKPKKGQPSTSDFTDNRLPGHLDDLLKQRKVTKTEFSYIDNASEIAAHGKGMEDAHKKLISKIVKDMPLWKHFLKDVRGIDVILAGNTIAVLGNGDEHSSISALWANFGYHVVCPKCTRTVVDWQGKDKEVPLSVGKDGICPNCGVNGIAPKRVKGKGCNWDTDLRTMGYKIADCLMKLRSPIYRSIYDQEKERQLARKHELGDLHQRYKYKGKDGNWTSSYKPEDTHLTQGHAHNRAMRKIAKLFLAHCWVATRTFSGLPVTDPWVITHGGHTDHITWQKILKANGVTVPAEKSMAATS